MPERPRDISRRSFFSATALAGSAAVGAATAAPASNTTRCRPAAAREAAGDVLVIGGGLGGCAAALSAARDGKRVILTEETAWIGGQVTAQAVPPDENRWIESHGGTRLYRDYRSRVRDYYRRNYPLTDEARGRPNLNPGNGSVSALCHEPRVSLAVLHEMLAPYVSGLKITLLLNHKAVAVETSGGTALAVSVRDLETGGETVLRAPYIIDATEFGDLLPLAGVEYVTGAEAASETGEMHAAKEAQPQNMQAFTCCFAMDWLEGEDHTIDKPGEYGYWRDYVPQMTPPWTGRLLHWRTCHPHDLAPRDMLFDPRNESPQKRGLWYYRRIADRANFLPGAYPADICIVNWPQNDYWLGNLYEVPEDQAREHLRRGKQLSLSLLYWMQTEAPRPDGGTGWPGLRLRPDITGTDDGLALFPYVRESRRIRAEFTVLEQHVGKSARAALLGKPESEIHPEIYPDSVGIGYYRIDLHPSSGGDNYIDVDSFPFQIPLGSLITRRLENLLPGCKNLGVTHITNGCYRLHPVEWNIGEAAGALAAFCIDRKTSPRAVRNTPALLAEFQQRLRDRGVTLEWPQTG